VPRELDFPHRPRKPSQLDQTAHGKTNQKSPKKTPRFDSDASSLHQPPPPRHQRMSFLRTLADTFSSLLFSAGGGAGAPMDAAAPSPAAVVGERVAVKLKGYFELAKEEIDKAVRAEEWGLPDDAAAHYRNALRVMLEAKAARVPDAVPSRCVQLAFAFTSLLGLLIDQWVAVPVPFYSERGQVRVYQEKIAKWQTQVEERLRVLGQRGGQGIYPILVNFAAL
jgi:spastin